MNLILFVKDGLRGKRLNPQTSKPKQYQPKLQNANRSPVSACPWLSDLLDFVDFFQLLTFNLFLGVLA